jgi:hypothetical protein
MQIKKYALMRSARRVSQKSWPIINSTLSRVIVYFWYLDVILRREYSYAWGFSISMYFRQQISFCDYLGAIVQFLRCVRSRLSDLATAEAEMVTAVRQWVMDPSTWAIMTHIINLFSVVCNCWWKSWNTQDIRADPKVHDPREKLLPDKNNSIVFLIIWCSICHPSS